MAEVCVSFSRTPENSTTDLGFSGLAPVMVEQAHLPQAERGAPCKNFLAASTLCCYCSAFGNAIQARGGDYKDISGTARVIVGKNEQNLDRILEIVMDVDVVAAEAHRSAVEGAQRVMRGGCLITASMHACIKMTYNVTLKFED